MVQILLSLLWRIQKRWFCKPNVSLCYVWDSGRVKYAWWNERTKSFDLLDLPHASCD